MSDPLEMPADLEVVPATRDDAATLANLLELYIHDLGDFHALELGDDGRFGYQKLPLYWSEPNRYAFLLRARQKLAGFALLKRGSEITGDPNVWDMAEFFVARRYRRHGRGTEAARQIWRRFPGPWEVRVMEDNGNARDFWAHAIKAALHKTVSPVHAEIADRRWYVFAFDSPSVT